jgi:hypothetical protein
VQKKKLQAQQGKWYPYDLSGKDGHGARNLCHRDPRTERQKWTPEKKGPSGGGERLALRVP